MRRKWKLALALTALASMAGCPTGPVYLEGPPQARVTTSMGEFVIVLDPNTAPLTVANFEQYANDGFYDGTLMHRVVPGFVIQGGGYLPGLTAKDTRASIANEGHNGLKNVRGAVAMARTDDPNSATSQFFVNLIDNASLDATLTSPGYAVFGTVTSGMDVVDAISAVATTTVGDFQNVPVEDVVIQSVAIEAGPQVMSTSWADLQYRVEVYAHGVAVEVLSAVLRRL